MPPPESEPEPEGRRFDVVPILLLAVVVLVLLAGWLLFPWLQHTMFQQDCVAAGRTNC